MRCSLYKKSSWHDYYVSSKRKKQKGYLCSQWNWNAFSKNNYKQKHAFSHIIQKAVDNNLSEEKTEHLTCDRWNYSPHPIPTWPTHPTPAWPTPPYPTWPIPPLHDPPHQYMTHPTPPLHDPPHQCMTHPTPIPAWPTPPHHPWTLFLWWVGHVEVGWGGSCRGRWGVSCRGGVGHVGVGWGGSCRGVVVWDVSCIGVVGDVGVGWVMQGWGGSCRGGVGWGGSCRGQSYVLPMTWGWRHSGPPFGRHAALRLFHFLCVILILTDPFWDCWGWQVELSIFGTLTCIFCTKYQNNPWTWATFLSLSSVHSIISQKCTKSKRHDWLSWLTDLAFKDCTSQILKTVTDVIMTSIIFTTGPKYHWTM